jgi:hypothetical protein
MKIRLDEVLANSGVCAEAIGAASTLEQTVTQKGCSKNDFFAESI